MDFLSHNQMDFLENFTNHSRKLIEHGFAYVFAHQELIPLLNCERKKIQALIRYQRKNPQDKECYDKLINDAYLQYFMKLTRLGLKYIKYNPKTYDAISGLQNVFNDYDRIKNLKPNQKKMQETPMDVNTDTPFDEILGDAYDKMEQLDRKITQMQNKVHQNSRNYSNARSIRRSQDCLIKYKAKVEDRLNEIQKQKRIRQEKHEERKLRDEAMDLHNKIKQAELISRKNARKSHEETALKDDQSKEVNHDRKNMKIESESEESKSSEDDSSEIAIDYEIFSKNFQSKKQLLKPKVPIRKNIKIPVQIKDDFIPPKISSLIEFTKDIDGKMKINVELGFDQEVIYNNKPARRIQISNVLLDHKRR